jgi:Mrp family chromosome partitioning ATPase
MAATEYLKIVRRRWKLIAGLVIAAVAVVYWTSPEEVDRSYDSTAVFLVESEEGRGGSSAANPQVVAAYATVGEVPRRAAEQLGFDGEPSELAEKVEATADRNIGTVSITATDGDPEQAAEIANAFAEQVQAFLTERDAAEREQTRADAAAQIADLETQINALDLQIARNPPPPNLGTLTARRDALARRYSNLLEAQEENQPVQFRSLETATPGVEQESLPGTRSREQRMILAAVVALVLGFGLAIALDRSDTRVRTRQAAEAHFGLPVLAEIPLFSLPARHRKLVVSDDPDSIKAESYRTLRTAIMLYRRRDDAERDTEVRTIRPVRTVAPVRSVIMVTSAGAGDGKTTTAANLAVAYAESGRSVLVLSCDLWRSGVARHFGVKLGRGISDILAADDDPPLEGYIRDTSTPGVRLVTGGLAIRRPGGRLLAEQRLIEKARALADIVILDTAPLLSAALTRELATMVDAVVVVARVGRTTAGEAERCGDLLDQLGAPALGLVLVGVATTPFSDYFSYVSPRRTRRDIAKAQSAEETAAQETATQETRTEPDPTAATEATAAAAATEATEPSSA